MEVSKGGKQEDCQDTRCGVCRFEKKASLISEWAAKPNNLENWGIWRVATLPCLPNPEKGGKDDGLKGGGGPGPGTS